jgi:hypothetical protein
MSELFPSTAPPIVKHSALHYVTAKNFGSPTTSFAARSIRGPLVNRASAIIRRPHVSYFDDRFLAAGRLRTSVGDMSIWPGRGCSRAMCVDRRLVATCSPQNLQRALPGEIWTRCITHRMRGSGAARQARARLIAPRSGRQLGRPASFGRSRQSTSRTRLRQDGCVSLNPATAQPRASAVSIHYRHDLAAHVRESSHTDRSAWLVKQWGATVHD